MKSKIKQICGIIDDSDMKALGVKKRSLELAITREVFPASWYLIVKELCEKEGIACPPHLFNFKVRK